MNAPATNSLPPDSSELLDLFSAVRDETATPEQFHRLEDLLRTDGQSASLFVRLMRVHALFERNFEIPAESDIESPYPSNTKTHADSEHEVHSPLHSPLSTYFSSGWPVAYLIATVLFAIGLAIGAIVHVSQPGKYVGPRGSAHTPNPQSPIPNPSSIVARVTGMVDCIWEDQVGWVKRSAAPPRIGREEPLDSDASNHKSEIVNHKSLLRLGDRLALRSGLLEITYDTGAKVILQGPVTYEVESPTGGYLAIGKLTAKLEKKSEVRGQRSESANQKSEIKDPESPDRCPLTSDLFAISTPTATVTDLGTEFGVEVDKSGSTTSRVFRGSVNVQLVAGDGTPEGDARILRQNESARIAVGKDKKPAFVAAPSDRSPFVRRLPGRIPIQLFNTGAGVKEGQPDPHWQIVAAGDDPASKPRPAVVAKSVEGLWMPNAPKRSQWISIKDDAAAMLNDITTCTFRTHFDLLDVRPETARLRCRIIADSRLRAVRLNGHDIPVPDFSGTEFGSFHGFTIAAGFVEGNNALEIDVENGGPVSASKSTRAIRATGGVTLFRDDFEATSPVSRAPYPDRSGDYDPSGGAAGSWTIQENDGKNVQVIDSVKSPDLVAVQGGKCLRLRREVVGVDTAAAMATFVAPATIGTRLRVTQMIYIPAVERNTPAIAQITVGDAINLIANYGGYTNGAVVSHLSDNDTFCDTGVTFLAGKWQKWQIDYDVGSHICTLTIDGRSATAIPVNLVDEVTHIKLHANPDANNPVYVDDVSVLASGGPMGVRVELEGSAQQKQERNAP